LFMASLCVVLLLSEFIRSIKAELDHSNGSPGKCTAIGLSQFLEMYDTKSTQQLIWRNTVKGRNLALKVLFPFHA
jgi:hypothetical protein